MSLSERTSLLFLKILIKTIFDVQIIQVECVMVYRFHCNTIDVEYAVLNHVKHFGANIIFSSKATRSTS